MTYPKTGPFTDYVNSPGLSAEWANNVETEFATLDATLTGVATPEMFIASATKDASGNVTDWAPAINAAFNSGYTDMEFANKYYSIASPISIPSNIGPRLFSRGGKKAAYLNVNMPSGYETRGVVEYLGAVNGTSYNYAGITVENIAILGNNSVCHGFRIQDVSYPNFQRVNVAGLQGAGLLIDNCEDGYFDIEVQDCGRTTGSYASETDRGNNSLTTYAGVHLISSTSGSHNNMLRFTGEIEQMKTSPYVWIHDIGASNLWFNDIHSEVRESPEWGNFDFLVSDGADCEFKGVYCAPTFRNGFLLSGYGTYKFIGGRHLNNVIQADANSHGRLSMSNCSINNLSIEAWSGPHLVSGCTIDGNFSIDYPGGGPTRVVDTQITGNVSITNRGSGDTGVYVDNCSMNNYTADINTAGAFLRHSHVRGNMSNLSPGGYTEDTITDGTAAWNQDNGYYQPRRRYNYLAAIPTGGTWAKNDVVWNSNCVAGGVIGWVCITAGSPGSWKSFGAISA